MVDPDEWCEHHHDMNYQQFKKYSKEALISSPQLYDILAAAYPQTRRMGKKLMCIEHRIDMTRDHCVRDRIPMIEPWSIDPLDCEHRELAAQVGRDGRMIIANLERYQEM